MRWMPGRSGSEQASELHFDADVASFFDSVSKDWLVAIRGDAIGICALSA